jgi:hypothetical protein
MPTTSVNAGTFIHKHRLQQQLNPRAREQFVIFAMYPITIIHHYYPPPSTNVPVI